MDKQQYLDELRVRLKGLPQEEILDAIRYCEEYFDDASMDDQAQVLKDLGSPYQFAAQIKADCEIKRQHTATKQESHMTTSMKTILLLIAGICALPLALPLVIVMFVCLFVVVVVLASVLFAGMISTISMITFALPMIVRGIIHMDSIYEACMLVGGGIFIIGLACLWVRIIIWFINKVLPFVVHALTRLYNQMKEKTKHEK